MGAAPLHLGEDLASLLRRSDRPTEDEAREPIVAEPYRRGIVSRGKAAARLGVSLETFLRYAGKLGIPYIDLTEDEWEAEKRAVRAIAATLPPSATRVR